jgi:glycosyltransferase involved in cell wall biosynthesis
MRRLREEAPELAQRLRLAIAGRLDRNALRLVQDSGVDEQILILGELPHAESLAVQRRADALVLIASAEGSEVTGKLFEYLSAGRPIIALAGPAVGEIVSHTQTGVTVRPDDVDEIAVQLRRLINGQLAAAYRPVNLEQYVYPGPALRMAGVIEEAIASRVRW